MLTVDETNTRNKPMMIGADLRIEEMNSETIVGIVLASILQEGIETPGNRIPIQTIGNGAVVEIAANDHVDKVQAMIWTGF